MKRVGSALTVGALVLVAAPGLSAQSTTRVSVDSNGVQGNNDSGTYGDGISADGRCVAFGSGATNLVPGGSPLQRELFLHDTSAGASSMVSVDPAGTPGRPAAPGRGIAAVFAIRAR